MRLTLQAPAGFSFRRTVLSHGWYSLPPFELDERAIELRGVMALAGGGAMSFSLRDRGDRIVAESASPGNASKRRALRAAVRRVLNLDLDLGGFYEAVDGAGLGWIAEGGYGRLMRAPTAFEDLVKLVLTTNCSWALTTNMVRALVGRYGEAAPDGRHAFPRPEALARAGSRALRRQARTGYRAPYLASLGREVACGRLDPQSWEGDGREPGELREEMLGLPGVGPYVAENVLRLLGRPAGLGLDSWLRAKYARVYHGGRRVTDRTIARRYARFGDWAGLVLWCDMTRDWIADDTPSVAGSSLT